MVTTRRGQLRGIVAVAIETEHIIKWVARNRSQGIPKVMFIDTHIAPSNEAHISQPEARR